MKKLQQKRLNYNGERLCLKLRNCKVSHYQENYLKKYQLLGSYFPDMIDSKMSCIFHTWKNTEIITEISILATCYLDVCLIALTFLLKSYIYWPPTHFSRVGLLRAIWEVVSWAIVLNKTVKKLTSELLHCACLSFFPQVALEIPCLYPCRCYCWW